MYKLYHLLFPVLVAHLRNRTNLIMCRFWYRIHSTSQQSVVSTNNPRSRINSNGSFTPNNLLPTVRSDCKILGVAPIASNGQKPIRSDSRELIYLTRNQGFMAHLINLSAMICQICQRVRSVRESDL